MGLGTLKEKERSEEEMKFIIFLHFLEHTEIKLTHGRRLDGQTKAKAALRVEEFFDVSFVL